VGFVVGKAAREQVFSEYFGFPYQSLIPLIAPQSSSHIVQVLNNKPINGLSKILLIYTPAQ
jgi:hypothetical protein